MNVVLIKRNRDQLSTTLVIRFIRLLVTTAKYFIGMAERELRQIEEEKTDEGNRTDK